MASFRPHPASENGFVACLTHAMRMASFSESRRVGTAHHSEHIVPTWFMWWAAPTPRDGFVPAWTPDANGFVLARPCSVPRLLPWKRRTQPTERPGDRDRSTCPGKDEPNSTSLPPLRTRRTQPAREPPRKDEARPIAQILAPAPGKDEPNFPINPTRTSKPVGRSTSAPPGDIHPRDAPANRVSAKKSETGFPQSKFLGYPTLSASS
jgi:hypothetical protein